MNPKRHWISMFLYSILRQSADIDTVVVERERRTLERITRFALGENPKIAKFAARLLASLKDHESACVEIIEVCEFISARFCDMLIALKSISEKLSEATPEELVAHTTVLAQMARFKPDAFEHRSDTIMAFLIKKLLMGRRSENSVRILHLDSLRIEP